VTICAKRYQIWDTAGLGEGSEGRVPAKEAEKALKKLLSDLTQSRGVHLLVFCMRKGRITTTLEGFYRTFTLGVCQAKVPAVLVVTGLDDQVEREKWWSRNGTRFEGHGMTFRGHACVGWASRGPNWGRDITIVDITVRPIENSQVDPKRKREVSVLSHELVLVSHS
jgi:hypothetical protein